MSCESARGCLCPCAYGMCVCVAKHGCVRVCMGWRMGVVDGRSGSGLHACAVRWGSDRAVCLLCVLVLAVALAMVVLVLLGALAAGGVRRWMAWGCGHQGVSMQGVV